MSWHCPKHGEISEPRHICGMGACADLCPHDDCWESVEWHGMSTGTKEMLFLVLPMAALAILAFYAYAH